MAQLQSIKIHPAIGIARLGNHPTEFYIGPERPNQSITENEINSFKSLDASEPNLLKIKRQACRFRVFGYYDDGSISELNNNDYEIEWTVKITNKKAFSNKFVEAGTSNNRLRNGFVMSAQDRNSLKLTPKEINIKGVNQSSIFEPQKLKVKETTGEILESKEIILGELKTDEEGRLIALAGFGNSGSVKNHPIRNYVDNDYWYDDTADGYVKAKIKNRTSGEITAASDAWVIFASPRYVPNINPLISLHDTLFSRFVNEGLINEIERPLFYRDIYPILKKAINVKWLYKMDAHKGGTAMALNNPNLPFNVKEKIFNKLRKPDGTGGDMPRLFGDKYGSTDRADRLKLTTPQYNILKKWLNNVFDIDTIDSTFPLNEITPQGLDKAALENCAGGGFYPGIETSWFIRDVFEFSEPFRLDSSLLEPGDLTKQNALPWQADFRDCRNEDDPLSSDATVEVGWWPYSRPNNVFRENDGNNYHEWAPNFTFEDMVEKWKYLGIVVEKNGKYVEVQRQFPDIIA